MLFDFGNTLFARAPLDATIVSAGAAIGAPVDVVEAVALAERIDAAAASPAEARHGRDLDADVWRSRWHELYAAGDGVRPGLGAQVYAEMHDPERWVPFADARRVLGELHRAGCLIGVVSNTGWDVREVFRAHGIDALVDTFTLSCEVGAAKPSAAIFTAACRSLGCRPEETVMVGDDPLADVGGVPLGVRTLILPPTPPGSDNGLDAAAAMVGG